MTYEDAMKALDYLETEIGVTGGEAYEEAVQEIADKLGDQNFIQTVGGRGLWSIQRARDIDSMKNSRPMTQEEWDAFRNLYSPIK